jgi:hypothetical protein
VTSEQSGQFHYGTFRQNEPVSLEVYPSPTHVTERVFVEQKRTGFRRSEFREETHEKACLIPIYDQNRDLIRAKPRRHIGRARKGRRLHMRVTTNLGPDPVQGAVDIVQEAEAQLTKKVLAEKYLQPYVDRIIKQQKKSKK